MRQNVAKMEQNVAKMEQNVATVGKQWDTVGTRSPDPYHGVGTRYAPCPAPTTPGTPPPAPPPARVRGAATPPCLRGQARFTRLLLNTVTGSKYQKCAKPPLPMTPPVTPLVTPLFYSSQNWHFCRKPALITVRNVKTAKSRKITKMSEIH